MPEATMKRTQSFKRGPFAIIRKLLGAITRPSVMFRVDKANGEVDYFVEAGGIPLTEDTDSVLYLDFSYRYTYVKVEQNFFGVWKQKKFWIGRGTPLTKRA